MRKVTGIAILLLLLFVSFAAEATWYTSDMNFSQIVPIETPTGVVNYTFYRDYDVYAPANLPDDSPVLFIFHAEGIADIQDFVETTEFPDVTDAYTYNTDKFVIVVPHGLQQRYPIDNDENYYWGYVDTTDATTGLRALNVGIHDDYLGQIIEELNDVPSNANIDIDWFDWTEVYGLGVHAGGYVLHRLALSQATGNEYVDDLVFETIGSVNTWADSEIELSSYTSSIPVYMFNDADYYYVTDEIWHVGEPEDHQDLDEMRVKLKHITKARDLAAHWALYVNGWSSTDTDIDLTLETRTDAIRGEEIPSTTTAVEFEASWSGAPADWPTETTAHDYDLLGRLLHWFNFAESELASLGHREQVVSAGTQPESFVIDRAYPNPFNATTVLRLTLTDSYDTKVVLQNVLGQTVQVLHDGMLEPGSHEFEVSAEKLASGMYFLETNADGIHDIQKIMLVR